MSAACLEQRFIYGNGSAVEIENFDYVRRIIERDFDTYSGKPLEELFKTILIESKQFNHIGSYWDSKGEEHASVSVFAISKATYLRSS